MTTLATAQRVKRLNTKQKIALIAPPALLASTYLTFNLFVSAFGFKMGYFCGFLFYWLLWCLAFPSWLIGIKNIRGFFGKTQILIWPRILILFTPVALAYVTKFPEVLPLATAEIVIASIIIAIVNATAEEILWRGVYLTLFPARSSAGFFYQAVWFGIWHLAPQSVNPNTLPGGTWSLVAFAVGLGLAWGSVAWQTHSIRPTVLAHIMLNAAGLGALVYLG